MPCRSMPLWDVTLPLLLEGVYISPMSCFVNCFDQWNVVEGMLLELQSLGLTLLPLPSWNLPWNQQAAKERGWSTRGWEACGGELKCLADTSTQAPTSPAQSPAASSHLSESRWDQENSQPVEIINHCFKPWSFQVIYDTTQQLGNW